MESKKYDGLNDQYWSSANTEYEGSLAEWKNNTGYEGGYQQVRYKYQHDFGNNYSRPNIPWRIDATGFAEDFNAGWSNWDPNGIGNAWMNIAAGGIIGAFTLPVASVAGTGLGMQGLGGVVTDVSSTVAAKTYFNVVYRVTPTAVNIISNGVSRSAIGYSGQKLLMTHGKHYVDFGRAVLQNPEALYTPSNFNFMYNTFMDFKRFKSLIE